MAFLILLLMVLCIAAMLKLNIEKRRLLLFIMSADALLSLIIVMFCRGTDSQTLAIAFFIANVLVCPWVLFYRMNKELPAPKKEKKKK